MFHKIKNMSLESAKAQLLFNEWNQREDVVVLDSETTGLWDAEICEIAVIDLQGNSLFNSFVKPVHPIPYEAYKIHGINDDMVKHSPGWLETWDKLYPILKDKLVLIYNDEFDHRLMHESFATCDLNDEVFREKLQQVKEIQTACVMRTYTDLIDSSTWVKLTFACGHSTKHRAMSDCRATLEVIKNNYKPDFTETDYKQLKLMEAFESTTKRIRSLNRTIKALSQEQSELLAEQEKIILLLEGNFGEDNAESEVAATYDPFEVVSRPLDLSDDDLPF
ncbi:3'-5' exonuclease [Shimazuella alba]|uniref:Exonuclease domain-containing protein n=1 Tax=Shimazuella alba TaxID=2690964 RepID=A0A6I4W4R4_9BACL|nr:3'-5' exonuclease [Shimazuella alba]MXQ55292.1 hypothetical protein [Shimazuella alba]